MRRPTSPLLSLYSSILGIPIGGLSDTANTAFSLEPTYMSLDCRPFALVNVSTNDFISPGAQAALDAWNALVQRGSENKLNDIYGAETG